MKVSHRVLLPLGQKKLLQTYLYQRVRRAQLQCRNHVVGGKSLDGGLIVLRFLVLVLFLSIIQTDSRQGGKDSVGVVFLVVCGYGKGGISAGMHAVCKRYLKADGLLSLCLAYVLRLGRIACNVHIRRIFK